MFIRRRYQSITSVEIPDGIELIGDGAFMECTNLKSVSFPTNYFGDTLYIL